MKGKGLRALLCARIGEGVEKPGSAWESSNEGRSSAEMVDGSKVELNAESAEFTEAGGNGTELGKGARDGEAEGLVRERIMGYGSRSSYRLSIVFLITDLVFEWHWRKLKDFKGLGGC